MAQTKVKSRSHHEFGVFQEFGYKYFTFEISNVQYLLFYCMILKKLIVRKRDCTEVMLSATIYLLVSVRNLPGKFADPLDLDSNMLQVCSKC